MSLLPTNKSLPGPYPRETSPYLFPSPGRQVPTYSLPPGDKSLPIPYPRETSPYISQGIVTDPLPTADKPGSRHLAPTPGRQVRESAPSPYPREASQGVGT